MKPFHEHLRFDYDLTPDSLVIDLGGYDGTWSRNIASLYQCRVICFEPVKEQFIQAQCNALGYPSICVINAAVSVGGSVTTIGISNNSSGVFSPSEERREVSVVKIIPLISVVGRVALMKLNIEGNEYDILEAILSAGKQSQIDNFQIQFHQNAPDWEARYKKIQEQLSKTHEQEWSSVFTWENWRLKL